MENIPYVIPEYIADSLIRVFCKMPQDVGSRLIELLLAVEYMSSKNQLSNFMLDIMFITVINRANSETGEYRFTALCIDECLKELGQVEVSNAN